MYGLKLDALASPTTVNGRLLDDASLITVFAVPCISKTVLENWVSIIGVTVKLNVLAVASEPGSVTVTVNVLVVLSVTSVGVPVIVAFAETNVNPVGTEPEVKEYVTLPPSGSYALTVIGVYGSAPLIAVNVASVFHNGGRFKTVYV